MCRMSIGEPGIHVVSISCVGNIFSFFFCFLDMIWATAYLEYTYVCSVDLAGGVTLLPFGSISKEAGMSSFCIS